MIPQYKAMGILIASVSLEIIELVFIVLLVLRL